MVWLLLAVASILLIDREFVGEVAFGICFALILSFWWKAWMAYCTPHTVIVGEQGMVLVYRQKEMSHPWTELSHALVGTGLSEQQHLILYDVSGRRVTKLSDDIENFDTMAKVVQRNIAETRARTEDRVALKRSWFLASAFIVTGCLLGPTACFLAWLTIWDFDEFVRQSESAVDIGGYLLFLGMWIFGAVMALLFVAGGVLHLARLEIKRSPSGYWFVFERESMY